MTRSRDEQDREGTARGLIRYARKLKLSESEATRLANNAYAVVRDQMPLLLPIVAPEIDTQAGATPEQFTGLSPILKKHIGRWLCAAIIVLYISSNQLPGYQVLVRQARWCAHRWLSPYMDVEDISLDIAQQAITRVLKTVWNTDPLPDNPLAWLRRIVKNLCIDYARRESGRARKQGQRVDEATVADKSGPGNYLDFRDLLHKVRQKYGPETAAMLEQYALEGRTHEDIASFFGKKPKTVGKRIQRALTYLRTAGE